MPGGPFLLLKATRSLGLRALWLCLSRVLPLQPLQWPHQPRHPAWSHTGAGLGCLGPAGQQESRPLSPRWHARLCRPPLLVYSTPKYSADLFLVGAHHCAEREEGHPSGQYRDDTTTAGEHNLAASLGVGGWLEASQGKGVCNRLPRVGRWGRHHLARAGQAWGTSACESG